MQPQKRKRSLKRFFLHAACWLAGLLALPCLSCGVWENWPPTHRLPEASEVRSMTASFPRMPWTPKDVPTEKEFTVPPEHIPRVLQALTPHRHIHHWLTWPLKGKLRLSCADGSVVEVHLFWTRGEKGAFAVGPSGQRDYYAGGTDEGIVEALQAAYADSLKAKKD